MEDPAASPAPDRHRLLVPAPKDYFLGPVFAASPQAGPRRVIIGNREYQVGGFCPLPVKYDPPALDVRHARAVFALLSFRNPYEQTRLIRFSFNQFCRRYANSNGGRYSREIARILGDLMYSFIRVTDIQSKISHEYRIIEHVDIERHPRRRDAKLATSPQQEMWFNSCTLSQEFYNLLGRIAELHFLKLDVFTSIRSPLAQAIYLYIPSRAHHHSEADPFEIGLANLLHQVSATVPAHKSRRKELFTKNRNSILQQLEGLETSAGRFHVRLAETNDQTDWKLQAWVERRQRKLDENSKLVAAYLRSGRPREYLDRVLAAIPPLEDYELELLAAGNVEIDKNRRFFEKAKAILRPPLFRSLLAEAKGDELEGRKATRTPTARLIDRIMKTVAAPAGAANGAWNPGLDN